MPPTSPSRRPQPNQPNEPAVPFLQAITDAIRLIEDEAGTTLDYLVPTVGEPLPVKQPPGERTSKLARTTAEYANTAVSLDLPGLYYVLLATCPLPDRVAEEVAARAGRAGTIALAHNPYLSEHLWAKAYRATAGVGRHPLLSRRLLTRAQRGLVVAAREKSPFVLPEVIGQLDEDDLRQLAGSARGRALAMLEAELDERAAGEGPAQLADGAGAVMLRSKVAGGWAVGNGTFRLPEGVLASPVADFTGRRLTLSVMGDDPCDTFTLSSVLAERLGDGATAESVAAWVTCVEMATTWSGTVGELLDAVDGVLHTA